MLTVEDRDTLRSLSIRLLTCVQGPTRAPPDRRVDVLESKRQLAPQIRRIDLPGQATVQSEFAPVTMIDGCQDDPPQPFRDRLREFDVPDIPDQLGFGITRPEEPGVGFQKPNGGDKAR
jgi:hypothetical protein